MKAKIKEKLDDEINAELDFASRIGKLKDMARTGWKIRSVENPESVSDHSFRVAILSMLYGEKLGLDSKKCIEMALIHDLPESVTGNGLSDGLIELKIKNEKNALKTILSELPKTERIRIMSIWKDYRLQITEEAKLVCDLDKIEMILQAFEYKKDKRTFEELDDFFETSAPKIKTKLGEKLWSKIKSKYDTIKNK